MLAKILLIKNSYLKIFVFHNIFYFCTRFPKRKAWKVRWESGLIQQFAKLSYS